MYAVGENFEYMIEEEECDISVVGDIMMFGDEYLIGEDLDGKRYVFIYREDEEIVELVDEEDEASDIMDNWEDEYYAGGTDIGDWDDDSYYEREDKITTGSDDTEAYFEDDDYSESEEDVDSFISGLMGE
ncbi:MULTISPECIES: hypothetical protein [Psychrilyobacter]|uniref:DUF1292 domain-containing protein n=1 Tax=Psychrilyobacter piezotolerans TaxID=2293438 RepID=A0ABX9KH45_9FUSO|nr:MULTISPECIES: hypothetical protein [Psychrilyobacter]MCS5420734.1 hypothetical protein [Psychrilyobacter sp. S5]NDI77990.1 hypothetical protein [Psychrilyobacter piezotolerans]RDE61933.1 hypothetical protein DV867_08020 [Psychrilyobacter sp. S5]REI41159.1 hypothetical protein DYH56_08020 [Psychrilyobacter piezotolerans]